MIQLQSIPKCEKKDSLILGNYTCINNRPAYRICTQKNCPHPSLCCQDDDCTCNEVHQLCTQIRLKSLLQKLYSKVADTSQIMNKVTSLFDSIIDQVSQIYEQTQKRIKRYGLRHAQITFLQYLEQNRSHTLKGKIVHDANQIAGIKYDGQFQQIQRVVDKLWNQLGGLFWGMLYATKDIYEIPTRVNRLNPDSGEQFFADVIEQTKSILNSLQNMKVLDEKQVKEKQINWGVTKQHKQQEKVLKKQEQKKRCQQYRLQDLSYQEDEINKIQERRNDQLQVQIRQKSKLLNKRQQKVNDKIVQEKDQLQKRGQQRQVQENLFEHFLEQKQIEKKVSKNSKNSKSQNEIIPSQRQALQQQRKIEYRNKIQAKQDHFMIMKQKQSPLIFAQQKDQEQQQFIQKKSVQTEKSEIQKSKIKIYGETALKPSDEQQKLFNQACEYLNDTLGLGMKVCKQFVIKNGYNKEGKLLSMEEILDLVLTNGIF